MASSAALTTTHLPRLRKELDEWRAKQPPPQAFTKTLEDIQARLDSEAYKNERGKDVIVAFRTRPPLEHEADQKFKGNAATTDQDAEDTTTSGEESVQDDGGELEFCAGVSVASADPGVFVAHVPGMKVRAPLAPVLSLSYIDTTSQWSGPTLTHKKFDSDIAFGPDVNNDEVYQRTVIANDVSFSRLSSNHTAL